MQSQIKAYHKKAAAFVRVVKMALIWRLWRPSQINTFEVKRSHCRQDFKGQTKRSRKLISVKKTNGRFNHETCIWLDLY